jgi:hypothetical protein
MGFKSSAQVIRRRCQLQGSVHKGPDGVEDDITSGWKYIQFSPFFSSREFHLKIYFGERIDTLKSERPEIQIPYSKKLRFQLFPKKYSEII